MTHLALLTLRLSAKKLLYAANGRIVVSPPGLTRDMEIESHGTG